MIGRETRKGLQIAWELADFIENQALPGTGVTPELFWSGFARLVDELGPKNRELLAKRSEIQSRLDGWHLERKGRPMMPPHPRHSCEKSGIW